MKYEIKQGDRITWYAPKSCGKGWSDYKPMTSIVQDVMSWGIQTSAAKNEADGKYYSWNVREEEILSINGMSTRFMLGTSEMIQTIRRQRAVIRALALAVAAAGLVDIIVAVKIYIAFHHW